MYLPELQGREVLIGVAAPGVDVVDIEGPWSSPGQYCGFRLLGHDGLGFFAGVRLTI